MECFVKMVKRALKCLKPRVKVAFDDEELRTLPVQTQDFVNMRPLMNVRADQPPLTPANFLLTGSPRLHSIPVEAPEKMSLESRKEIIDANLREMWALGWVKFPRCLRPSNMWFVTVFLTLLPNFS